MYDISPVINRIRTPFSSFLAIDIKPLEESLLRTLATLPGTEEAVKHVEIISDLFIKTLIKDMIIQIIKIQPTFKAYMLVNFLKPDHDFLTELFPAPLLQVIEDPAFLSRVPQSPYKPGSLPDVFYYLCKTPQEVDLDRALALLAQIVCLQYPLIVDSMRKPVPPVESLLLDASALPENSVSHPPSFNILQFIAPNPSESELCCLLGSIDSIIKLDSSQLSTLLETIQQCIGCGGDRQPYPVDHWGLQWLVFLALLPEDKRNALYSARSLAEDLNLFTQGVRVRYETTAPSNRKEIDALSDDPEDNEDLIGLDLLYICGVRNPACISYHDTYIFIDLAELNPRLLTEERVIALMESENLQMIVGSRVSGKPLDPAVFDCFISWAKAAKECSYRLNLRSAESFAYAMAILNYAHACKLPLAENISRINTLIVMKGGSLDWESFKIFSYLHIPLTQALFDQYLAACEAKEADAKEVWVVQVYLDEIAQKAANSGDGAVLYKLNVAAIMRFISDPLFKSLSSSTGIIHSLATILYHENHPVILNMVISLIQTCSSVNPDFLASFPVNLLHLICNKFQSDLTMLRLTARILRPLVPKADSDRQKIEGYLMSNQVVCTLLQIFIERIEDQSIWDPFMRTLYILSNPVDPSLLQAFIQGRGLEILCGLPEDQQVQIPIAYLLRCLHEKLASYGLLVNPMPRAPASSSVFLDAVSAAESMDVPMDRNYL